MYLLIQKEHFSYNDDVMNDIMDEVDVGITMRKFNLNPIITKHINTSEYSNLITERKDEIIGDINVDPPNITPLKDVILELDEIDIKKDLKTSPEDKSEMSDKGIREIIMESGLMLLRNRITPYVIGIIIITHMLILSIIHELGYPDNFLFKFIANVLIITISLIGILKFKCKESLSLKKIGKHLKNILIEHYKIVIFTFLVIDIITKKFGEHVHRFFQIKNSLSLGIWILLELGQHYPKCF